MKRRNVAPLLGSILRKVAPKLGAKIVMEPKWGIVGQIVFPDKGGRKGKKRYFRYSTLDLNPVGASDIAKDKDYANFFMRRMGYPTIPGKAFYSREWAKTIGSRLGIDAAYRYARSLGFPVIVKPNSGSQGTDVALVHTKRDLYRRMNAIFRRDRVALVQKRVPGRDYRVVVLDGKIISAYERIPLNVEGDGRSTIRQLLMRKQKAFIASSRDTRLQMNDPRIAEKLKRQGLTFRSSPARGERIYLLDNANLSSGGDAVDVTSKIHPEFKKLCIRLTEDMGLRMCGVDLMIEGRIDEAPRKFWVLEINAAPGLDHYVKTGPAQQRIVEKLYLQVLKSLEK